MSSCWPLRAGSLGWRYHVVADRENKAINDTCRLRCISTYGTSLKERTTYSSLRILELNIRMSEPRGFTYTRRPWPGIGHASRPRWRQDDSRRERGRPGPPPSRAAGRRRGAGVVRRASARACSQAWMMWVIASLNGRHAPVASHAMTTHGRFPCAQRDERRVLAEVLGWNHDGPRRHERRWSR